MGHDDLWCFVIKCQHGHISPAGDGWLWACTNRRAATTKLVTLAQKKDNNLAIKMWGDDGVNVEFHVSDFAMISKIIKPLGA